MWARSCKCRQTPPVATLSRGPQGQGRRVIDWGFITYILFYTFLCRNLKVAVTMVWIIQKNWSMPLECIVFWQCVFLPNVILGPEHMLVNMVKVCWVVRGRLVLGTIYRPPTKCKVHTWIIKCWLYWKHNKWLSWTLSKEGGNPVNCSDSCLCFLGLENHGEKSEKMGGGDDDEKPD